RLQQPPGAADHAVPPPLRQRPPEDLEDTGPVGGPLAQRRLDHGQLVVIGTQRRRDRHSARVGVWDAVPSGRITAVPEYTVRPTPKITRWYLAQIAVGVM